MATPLFTDSRVVASFIPGSQCVLGQFAAECEADGMRISTSYSESMVLTRPLGRGGRLPSVEELKYLGAWFVSEGRMEGETDR